MYETENGNLMKDGMIHFSFGILAGNKIAGLLVIAEKLWNKYKV